MHRQAIGHALTQIDNIYGKLANGGLPLCVSCRFVNHNLYWAVMCNDPGSNQPEEPLLGKLQETFGTFEGFKDHFTYASLSVFGSGYVWLVEDGNGNLQIIKTKNQVFL